MIMRVVVMVWLGILATSGFPDTPNPPNTADTETARLIAQSCTGCHTRGSASASASASAATSEAASAVPSAVAIPAINDLPVAALERVLMEFKKGNGSGTVMNRIARGYSENDIQLLATGLRELRKANGDHSQ